MQRWKQFKNKYRYMVTVKKGTLENLMQYQSMKRLCMFKRSSIKRNLEINGWKIGIVALSSFLWRLQAKPQEGILAHWLLMVQLLKIKILSQTIWWVMILFRRQSLLCCMRIWIILYILFLKKWKLRLLYSLWIHRALQDLMALE